MRPMEFKHDPPLKKEGKITDKKFPWSVFFSQLAFLNNNCFYFWFWIQVKGTMVCFNILNECEFNATRQPGLMLSIFLFQVWKQTVPISPSFPYAFFLISCFREFVTLRQMKTKQAKRGINWWRLLNLTS